MKFNDLTILLEQNEGSMFISRGGDRQKRYKQILQQEIQDYIKNGSKGDLFLNNTPIESLPDNLKKVHGSLYLNGSKITSLPAGLDVKGSLILANTPIKSLPKQLKVRGALLIGNTRISILPDDIRVESDIHISHTPLQKRYSRQEIKKMYPRIKGEVY